MGSLQTWSSNEFFSAAVLKQRKRARLKIQTPRRVRYLLHYFDQNSTVPHWARRGRLEIFQSSKGSNFDQRMLFNGSHGFLRFFTRFSTQKVWLSQRDHSHTIRLANAQLKWMPGRFLKNSSFMLFKAVKNNKLGSVKIFSGIKWTLQADFSKGLGMGFFKDVSDGFTKGALRAIK